MEMTAGKFRLPRLKTRLTLLALLAVGIFLGSGAVASAQGSGVEDEVARTGVNFSWTLMAAFLVFFMQAGFAFLGAGLIRSKSTVNYMTKSLLDFCIASLSFWAFGFALMWGGSAAASGLTEGNAFIGTSGFFLAGDADTNDTSLVWIFQMVFAGTAATIVAGAVAERTRIDAYLAYSFVLGAIIYPVYGHWVWGGGWLGDLSFGSGAIDFAGSGVVHAVGGMVALAGATMVGPRIGKFNADGTPNEIPGHNMPYVVIGTFILFFGWFGFNAGSTLMGTDTRIAAIATNTLLAGTTGAVVAFYAQMARTGRADLAMSCNGALAGLVGITAPCAYVSPWAAVVIGGVASVVMMTSLVFVERKLKVDDPVGAVSVHGAAGLWGLLAVGIFANGTYGGVSGLVDGGQAGQLAAQLVSIGTVVAWAFGAGMALFWVLKKTMGLRASPEEELEGLDLPEHGVHAYPEMMPQVAHPSPAGDDGAD